MKILLLNSPPRTGRNLVSQYLESSYRAIHLRFSEPVYHSIPHLFGICPDEWDKLHENERETPHSKLQGMTPRQTVDWVSNGVLKKSFGSAYLGVLASRVLINLLPPKGTTDRVFVFSDATSVAESKVLTDVFGNKDIHLVQIERPEYGFVVESSSYINPEDIGIPEENRHIVVNECNISDLYDQVSEILDKILKE